MEHIAPPNTIRQAVVALFSAPSWNVQAIMYSPYYTSFPEKVKRACVPTATLAVPWICSLCSRKISEQTEPTRRAAASFQSDDILPQTASKFSKAHVKNALVTQRLPRSDNCAIMRVPGSRNSGGSA